MEVKRIVCRDGIEIHKSATMTAPCMYRMKYIHEMPTTTTTKNHSACLIYTHTYTLNQQIALDLLFVHNNNNNNSKTSHPNFGRTLVEVDFSTNSNIFFVHFGY